MKYTSSMASAAVIALLCSMPALAQEQKGSDGMQGKQPNAQATTPNTGAEGQKTQKKSADTPKSAQTDSNTKTDSKKNTAEKGAATPSDKGDKGAGKTNTQAEGAQPKKSQDKAAGTANDNKSGGTKTQDKAAGAQDKSAPKNAGAGQTPSDSKDAPKSATKKGDQERVQLSAEQRTNIHRDILKERNVNRVNVRVNVEVGSRVPRSVRLAPLPAAIVSIVPAYRDYRYFVVDQRIYIVEPRTQEVVTVITEDGRQSASAAHSGRLSLSAEERRIVLAEIDIKSGDNSTLGLGALTVGASVPRSVEIMTFPSVVVEKVPKLQGYRYFVAENRVAIVDQDARSIALLIEIRN